MRKILLFVPMYNCERQIGRVIEKITPEVLRYVSEIIVVDNRSTDRSREIAAGCLKNLGGVKVTLLQNDANYSLGGSIKVALNYALGHGYEYMVVVHGDDQADVRDIVPLLQDETAYDNDLCIGARFHPESRLHGYSPLRIAGNKAFNLLLGLITRRRIDDLIAGLNMYRMSAFADRWYMYFPDNLTFDAHMLLYALHHRFCIRYFPISWREEDQVSNAKVFRQGWILLKLFLGYAVKQDAVFDRMAVPANAYSAQIMYSHAA